MSLSHSFPFTVNGPQTKTCVWYTPRLPITRLVELILGTRPSFVSNCKDVTEASETVFVYILLILSDIEQCGSGFSVSIVWCRRIKNKGHGG